MERTMSTLKKTMSGAAKRCSSIARINELYDRILEKFPGFDPIEQLIVYAQHPLTEDSLRVKCLSEISKYMYPSLKALEISGTGENGEIELNERIVKFIKPKKEEEDD
jgi:hypothetical protein